MKRLLNITLMAVTICCLSLAVTSCKDDDSESNNGGNTQEQTDGEMNAADRFWAVAANLVSPFDVTEDYAGKTFEPTIGEAENGNETVRLVNATDIDVAASIFADITGVAVNKNTTSYTFQDDAVGTLTYNKSTDGKSLATVDVSIKQIPHLQKIVFKSQEQMGDNASAGQPYYSFGDVISRVRKEDGKTEYWVCVHPAFTPQGQKTSYWVSLNQPSQKNIKTYTGSNGITYNVPTGLGKSEQQMQNLAELIYALYEPALWEKHLATGPDPFGDIIKENAKYINKHFWSRVREEWDDNKLATMVFGKKLGEIIISMMPKNGGLHLLHSGYSWWFKTSNKCTLYEYTYTMNGSDLEANGHRFTQRNIQNEMIKSKMTLDCIDEYANGYWVNKDFFGDEKPRYIFRFATDKELFGKKTDIYTSMASNGNIKDVYVYTKAYNIEVGKNHPMKEITPFSYYHTGDVYTDEDGHHWMVTYMSCVGDSPYSELVSLDACSPKQNKSKMSNAPTKDELLHGLPYLWYLSHSTYSYNHIKKDLPETVTGVSPVILKNLISAKIDPRALIQYTDKEVNARNETGHFSIAYADGTDNSGKQPLMRFILTSDLGQNDLHFNLWEHYPAKPDNKSKYYYKFSSVPIYLQDIANENRVKTYGIDYYATRPIVSYEGTGDNRNYRTSADNNAKEVTNYIYDYQTWYDETNLGGMWNEPVVIACFDAVYDDPAVGFSKNTVKGRKLKRYKLVPMADEVDLNVIDQESLKKFWDNYSVLFNGTFTLDGKNFKSPDYKAVWGEPVEVIE